MHLRIHFHTYMVQPLKFGNNGQIMSSHTWLGAWFLIQGVIKVNLGQEKESLVVSSPYSYREISNISRTKSQNWTDSRPVFQLSSPNPFKPGVESTMKM